MEGVTALQRQEGRPSPDLHRPHPRWTSRQPPIGRRGQKVVAGLDQVTAEAVEELHDAVR